MGKIFNNKKAQITIFIIIGILLLVGTSLYFSLRSGVTDENIESYASEVPLEIKPIQQFIETCMYDVSKEAFIKLGQHGGYIDLNDLDLSGKEFKMNFDNPTESDVGFLNLNENSYVSYWWYLKSENDCLNCVASSANIPSIEKIEEQINKYMNKKLISCFSNFKSFKDIGFDITESEILNVESVIGEKDIIIKLFHPINISNNDRKTEISRYLTRLNLDFKQIYEFSNTIIEKEIELQYLENITKHIVSLNARPSIEALPPIYASEETNVPITWSKTLTKFKLQKLLQSHIPLVQINKTKNSEKYIIITEELNNVYNPFYLNIFEEDEEKFNPNKYEIKFNYLNYPYYMDITPSLSELIPPSRIVNIKRGIHNFEIPFMLTPLVYYEYYYDISYPVIIEIKSYNEFFNETYTFFIATEVNLRDNKNLKEWFEGYGTYGPQITPIVTLSGNSEIKEALESQETDENIESLPVITGNYNKTLFCTGKQKISGNVSIIIKDEKTKDDLEGVDIVYSCGTYQSCGMGTTSKKEINGIKTINLISQFPICINGGIITLRKNGYITKKITDLTTLPNNELKINTELTKIITKNITFKKYILNRILYNDSLLEEHKYLEWNNTLHNLGINDMILLSLIRIPDENNKKEFNAFSIYYGDETKNIDQFKSIELIPGKYTITLQYFYNKNITLPKKCFHECDRCGIGACEYACRAYPDDYTEYCNPAKTTIAGVITGSSGTMLMGAIGSIAGSNPHNLVKGVTCAKCECDVDYYIPEDENMDLSTSILGGYIINNSNPIMITTYDLYSTKDLEFHFVQSPPPRCVQDLNEYNETLKFHDSNRIELIPKFI